MAQESPLGIIRSANMQAIEMRAVSVDNSDKETKQFFNKTGTVPAQARRVAPFVQNN